MEELVNKLRVVNQATEKQIMSVITLLIRMIRKYFSNKSLQQYHKDFVNIIKQTS